MDVSCGNAADHTNAIETIAAVTSRLAHVKKKNSMRDRVKLHCPNETN